MMTIPLIIGTWRKSAGCVEGGGGEGASAAGGETLSSKTGPRRSFRGVAPLLELTTGAFVIDCGCVGVVGGNCGRPEGDGSPGAGGLTLSSKTGSAEWLLSGNRMRANVQKHIKDWLDKLGEPC